MPNPQLTRKFDWAAIRAMFEAGNSPGYIEDLPEMPSRQAIWERAKREGWQKLDAPLHKSLQVIPFEGLNETQRFIVTKVAEGCTQRLAADMACIDQATISDWKHKPAFARAMLAAKAAKTHRRLAKIDESTDWRAAGWLVERDPDSRADYAPPNQTAGHVVGNTFNVLGQFNLGIERKHSEDEQRTIDATIERVVEAEAG